MVIDRAAVDELLSILDLGEAEAIILARETRADLLLMDERIGRAVALEWGVRTIGLLGALAAAKRQGLVQRVKPVIDALKDQAGFWVGDALYTEVLRQLGE